MSNFISKTEFYLMITVSHIVEGVRDGIFKKR